MTTNNPSGVFHAIHDIRIDNLPKPALNSDSVIIRVEMIGICGTDLHIYNEALVPSGSVLGHEFCGQIVEKGEDVPDLEIGQRVVVNPMYNGVGLGVSPGGFAHYVKIDRARKNYNVYPIPDSITSEKGALIEPFSVGLAAVNRTKYRTSDNVLVTGCGIIGLGTIAALKSKGVQNIIASDISEMRLELARKLGASHTFNPTKDGDLKACLEKEFGTVPSLNYAGNLPNLNTMFECTGVTAVLQQGTELLAPDGNLTVVALYSKGLELDPNNIVYKRLNIGGCLFYTDNDFMEAIELVGSGKVDITPAISHTFSLIELPAAFETQANGKISVKVVVKAD